MAKPNTTLRPVSFLDLPGEIKNLIYNIVLNGSVIKLDHKARGRLKDKSPPPPLDLSITPSKNAILGICHEVRNDAMPVLAKHTTLEIRNSFLREDPLRIVPTAFLGKISIINVDLDAFVHLKRELLPSLEHVGLIVRVEGITSIHQAIHFLHCPSCGGPDMVLAEGVGDMLDWPWMRNQIIQLSKAEGWTVDLKVLWECYSPNDSYLVSYASIIILRQH